MSATYQIGSDAELDEALVLYAGLPRDQQVFVLHYLRSMADGYKTPDDLPQRFWGDCFDQWKSGIDPFAARAISGGEAIHG